MRAFDENSRLTAGALIGSMLVSLAMWAVIIRLTFWLWSA